MLLPLTETPGRLVRLSFSGDTRDILLVMEWSGMRSMNNNPSVDIAIGAIVADGCFSLAFTLHLLGVPAGGLTRMDFVGAGLILSVFLSACWVIYDAYWQMTARTAGEVVKKLQIKELKQGARIEFDGKSYQVETINHRNGEILIQRIGQPGSIIVQIEGQSSLHSPQGQ